MKNKLLPKLRKKAVNPVENIGKSIKFVRIAADLKQGDMADKLGVSQNYLSLIENGKKEPSLSFLRKVSEIFDVPLSFLILEGSEDFESQQPDVDDIYKKLHSLMLDVQRKRIKKAHESADNTDDTYIPDHEAED